MKYEITVDVPVVLRVPVTIEAPSEREAMDAAYVEDLIPHICANPENSMIMARDGRAHTVAVRVML